MLFDFYLTPVLPPPGLYSAIFLLPLVIILSLWCNWFLFQGFLSYRVKDWEKTTNQFRKFIKLFPITRGLFLFELIFWYFYLGFSKYPLSGYGLIFFLTFSTFSRGAF